MQLMDQVSVGGVGTSSENYEVGKQDMSPEEWALHKCKETHDRAARTANVSWGLTRSLYCVQSYSWNIRTL